MILKNEYSVASKLFNLYYVIFCNTYIDFDIKHIVHVTILRFNECYLGLILNYVFQDVTVRSCIATRDGHQAHWLPDTDTSLHEGQVKWSGLQPGFSRDHFSTRVIRTRSPD